MSTTVLASVRSDSTAAKIGSGFITMPGPPRKGASSTTWCRSLVQSRKLWTRRSSAPASCARPIMLSPNGTRQISRKREMISTRTSLMFVGLDRDGWGRFVAKLAMANFPTGVGDVATDAKDDEGNQQGKDGQRRRRFWPFNRHQNGGRRRTSEYVEGPGELIGAMFMHFQPSLPLIIGH